MNCTRASARGVALLAVAAIVCLNFSASLQAQQIEWQGNHAQSLTSSANWNPNTTLNSTTGSYTLNFSTTGNLANAATILVGLDPTIKAMKIDNTGGLFYNSSNSTGLRFASASNNTSSASRILTFGASSAGGDIITLTNNANVSFNNATSSGNSISLTINLGYSGFGTLRTDSTSTLTVTGSNANIAGTGGLIKDGAGTLRISGNHSYSGGFQLKEGTVVLTSSGTNTTSSVLTSAWGTGNLTLSGGALIASTDTGRTVRNRTFLDGNVQITSSVASNDGNFTWSTAAGQSTTLISNSTLNIAMNVNWNQAIDGGFSLTKTGAGTLNLLHLTSSDTVVVNPNNTYTGGTFVEQGTLNGNVGGGDITISSGATYGLGGINQSVAKLSGAGNVVLGSHTLTAGSAENSTFSGVIGGSGGVTKVGSGALTLSGTNTYTGLTSLNEGTLVINGSLAGALDVAAGATLRGSGTIAGDVVIGGSHYAGNSPGTQTFGGNLTYEANSFTEFELAANTTDGAGVNFDQIIVNGTLNFAGATEFGLRFNAAGSTVDWTDSFWNTSRSWTVYEAAALTGFENLSIDGLNWADSNGELFTFLRPNSWFSLTSDGTNVVFNYNVIPEPSTYAAIIGIAALGLVAYRRRRRA